MPSKGVSTMPCSTPSFLATRSIMSTSNPTVLPESSLAWNGGYGRWVQVISLPGEMRVTPAAAAPPLVAPEPPPEPPESPDGVDPQAVRPNAATAATTTRGRKARRALTGAISWFGRRTDPDAQGGIMARAGSRSGIRPVTTAYHRGVVTGDDSRYDDLRTWSVGRLRSEQAARLRETVQAAYASVPHYRAAFDAVGLRPG